MKHSKIFYDVVAVVLIRLNVLWLVVVRAQAAVAPPSRSTVQYKGAIDAMMKVARAEGAGALWRGFGLNFVNAAIGSALLILYDDFYRSN